MIYLDNASGTKPYPQVIETITDVLQNHWGNASADNSFGHDAKMIIDNITQQVADDINCNQNEIIWTSGACEANSLAIYGLLQTENYHIYASKFEHASIYKALNDLDPTLCCVDYISNDTDGFISLEDLKTYLYLNKDDNYSKPFISVSFASSEIGVIQDIKSIAKIVHQYDGLLHVDATQIYPWCKINVKDLGIDLMSVSGQKLNSVKGIGFLYIRNDININPLIYGSQQDGRRGGTYPTHLIAAFGKALELTRKYELKWTYVAKLRDHLLDKLLKIENTHLNGSLNSRLPNNISLTIDGVNASTLMTMCDLMGIIISKGSACQSYESKPSEALLAIGLTPEQALSTIRITLDEFNTETEINEAAEIITKLIERIRTERI